MSLFLALLFAQAQPLDPAKALEDRVVKAIAAAEDGVVAVVVSHRKYPTPPPADKPWQLGGYQTPDNPNNFPRFAQAARPDPLRLSDPQTAADNTFGSGLVLSTDGLILTANHLIDGATKIYVRTADGKGSYADIHAADARSDLAVLKLINPPDGLTPVRMAAVRTNKGPRGEPATVRRGMWVIALGHPLAAGSADGAPSASWGILSNLRRRLATSNSVGSDNRTRPLTGFPTLLQTDARVTLGCSGGGLFNLDGEAIGLTSSIAGVTGAETAGGYAVPFDASTRRVIDTLRAGREVEYGFLGVTMGAFGSTRSGGGVILSGVTPGMPAEQAGLQAGDAIVGIDDHPVSDSDDLFLHVGAAQAGTTVRVSYFRGPQRLAANVTLAKHRYDDKALPWIASQKRPAAFGLRPDWSSVLVIDKGGSAVGLPAGVMVAELEPGSPAEEKFKPLGVVTGQWLVTAVNGRKVPTPAAFEMATAGRESVRLTLHNPAEPDRPIEVTLP